ncbi:MAG: hypothetical protein KBE07_15085 [Rhodoferax sp.]|nr:hypothetical protein [Rhodoferax sp.]
MQYQEEFSDAELARIIEEGLMYMCACPAQVAQGLRQLRELYRYQNQCMQDPANVSVVHQTICHSTILAHAQLQDCLNRVLELEQWDRATLRMPAGLRVRQMNELSGD